MLRACFLTLTFLPIAASAADDGRLSYLEQEVRNLRRQVMALSRQIEDIRTRPGRITPAAKPSADTPAADPSQWLDAAKWRKLRPGMGELEVIGLLGPPTSMREEGGSRVLLYAMEIGDSGYLGGSVSLRERAVVEIRPPTLQ